MPPKSAKKRQIQASLQKAREYRRTRVSSDNSVTATPITGASATEPSVEPSDMAEFLSMPESALDTDNEDIDPSFDLDASMKSDSDHMIESFCEDWISHLDRDDIVSLSLFLSFQLANFLGLGETEAAELASSFMMNRSEKTIREWRVHLFQNEGHIQESTQGKYQRSGIVWSREDLNKKSQKYNRKVKHYMFAYLGVPGGSGLEKLVKDY